MGGISRRFMETLQKKASKQVDEGKLRMLAGQFRPEDFENEEKLRQMIRSLAALSGKTLDEERENRIVDMFRSNEINLGDVQSLTKLLRQ
ncbi:stage VI sporulation protein F [Brevibacillus composti]|uniref:Stage VI sporulation protein F n=1 Tax=Brevibacillus composti TaxID=2796470 RepID=A0A7T5EHL0_9BACL|nr:stage VI sporulation protein F [Brevibacillus composti]QQE72771.1 stage VI sporulation protein F [Brevibacillus composti]QUO39849.1 stage VI sporulation protein F [Brevibacillus composti]